jgi:hypothetical protein
MIELGRINIMVSVAMSSCSLAAPCEGHLNEVLQIFVYLKEYDRSLLVFGHKALLIDEKQVDPRDWSHFYPDAAEAIQEFPSNAPEPLSMCSGHQ